MLSSKKKKIFPPSFQSFDFFAEFYDVSNFGENLVKILSVRKYFPKTIKKGQIWGKMLKIFTNMPKNVILCENHKILAKYAQPSWAHFTQNFLNRKRNIDMLKNLQSEKYAKAYFPFPYI